MPLSPAPAAIAVWPGLGHPSATAIGTFVLVVAATLLLTGWTARRRKTSSEYYADGSRISPLQAGFALAGDYMSAASFLGIAGLVALEGFDGMIYATGWLVGWPVLVILVAEPLRNLGQATFADVVASRLRKRPVRIAAAIGGIFTTLGYAVAQMVGSGTLISLLFGIPFTVAEILVGAAMLAYLLLGGLLSSTWIQVVKAVLLLVGVSLLAGLVLSRFGFSPSALYRAFQDLEPSRQLLAPGRLTASPLDALSLGLALMFGLLGLPHILVRFYTVPDARTARLSVLWATGLIGSFYLIIPFVGFGAAVLLSSPGAGAAAPMLGPELIRSFDAGGNLAAPLLAEVLGGAPLLGFVAAVGFTTVLAVVSGLTLASASTWSHDIYVGVIMRGRATEEQQVRGAKLASLAFGAIAVTLGIAYQGQNVAFLVGLSFAVAASANFPALLMSIIWRRFSTGGAVWSILVGAFSSVGLIVLSETIWVNVFHFPSPVFPLRNPALVSMPLAFAAGVVVSLLTPEPEAQRRFDSDKLRTYLGVGSDSTSSGR